MKIKAYLKPHCGWSNGVRAIMRKYNLEFEDIDIINDRANYEEMVRKSGQPLSPCVEIDGVMLAVDHDAIGEAFNITDGVATRCDAFFAPHARLAGVRRVPALPTWAVMLLMRLSQPWWRLRGQTPPASPTALRFLLRRHRYSIAKAQARLGYQPRIDLEQGMQQMLSGRVAGVVVLPGSGNVGTGGVTRVREGDGIHLTAAGGTRLAYALYHLPHQTACTVMRLIGRVFYKVKVLGRENIPDGSALILCNLSASNVVVGKADDRALLCGQLPASSVRRHARVAERAHVVLVRRSHAASELVRVPEQELGLQEAELVRLLLLPRGERGLERVELVLA